MPQLNHHGKPEILNTDQGTQFTSIEFIKTLKAADIQISMAGKGAWRDNVFVERLSRTIKYEEVSCTPMTAHRQPGIAWAVI